MVRPPTDAREWQLDYASDVLLLLTPRNRAQSPGPGGWQFKALVPGVTDVTVSPLMKSDGAEPAGPAAPPRFTVTVRVR